MNTIPCRSRLAGDRDFPGDYDIDYQIAIASKPAPTGYAAFSVFQSGAGEGTYQAASAWRGTERFTCATSPNNATCTACCAWKASAARSWPLQAIGSRIWISTSP